MRDRLTQWDKWIYGAGDLGFSLTGTMRTVYLLFFLTEVVGLRPALVSLVFLIGGTWDWINDPIIGYASDRTHTRWGRRRPFLLFGALPFAAAFCLLWWRPPLEGDLALTIYFVAAFALFETAATFVYMPYYALTPELTDDYDERTALTSTRMFFSILGGLLAFTVPLWIVGEFDPAHASRVLPMGVFFGLLAAFPLLLVFLHARERPEFMNKVQTTNLRHSIAVTWKNRPFVFGLGLFLFNGMSMSILEVVLLYYIKHVVLRGAESDTIMAVIFVVAMLALPLWGWISRKLNKRLAYVSGISFLVAVLLVLSSLTPGASFTFIVTLCVLAGIGVSAMHVLPWAIIPDAIEHGELQNGERQEGMFYSQITLFQKIASSLAVPLVALVLELSGYVAGSVEQPPSAIAGIRLITGPLPAITLGLGILFTLLFPLGREKHHEITRELEQRRKSARGETP